MFRHPFAVSVVMALTAASAHAQITWNFTYADVNTGFNDPTTGAARRAVVDRAVQYLNTVLDARGTVNFEWNASTFTGTGLLAQAGTSFVLATGFSNGLVFRRATTSSSLNPTDGDGEFNFGYNFYTGTGTPVGNQWDMQSVALHELTHALGFLSLINTGNGSGLGSGNTYSRLDNFLRNGLNPSDPRLINPNATYNSAVPLSALTGYNILYHGEFAVAANGGVAIRMAGGGDLSHVGEEAGNSVMRPSLANGTTRRAYSNLELGMLIDNGWNQFVWRNTTGNWADNVSSTTTPRWENVEGHAMLSPVGTITPNLVLRFGGTGATAYTSTNNLPLGATSDRFLVNRIELNAAGAATSTIASNGTNVLRFGTTIGVTPEIRQNNTGHFVLSHPVELTNAGLILGGSGTGVVTISGAIGVQSGQTGGLTKSGTSTFILTGNNTYNGITTVLGGTLRADNTAGSATGFALVNVAGGTLTGTGAVTGSVLVGGGGSLSAGAAGTGADRTLASGAVNIFGVYVAILYGTAATGDHGIVNATGGIYPIGSTLRLDLNGATVADLRAAVLAGGTPRVYTVMTSTSGVFGSFNTTDFTTAGFAASEWSVDYTTAGQLNLVFTPVPEPATVVGVGAVGLAVGAMWRRRRRTQAADPATAA